LLSPVGAASISASSRYFFRLGADCDKALAATDLARDVALGLRITLAAAEATAFDVVRFGETLCERALAADFLAFLLANGLLSTLPALLAALRPVPLIVMLDLLVASKNF